jgi:hypothetical protein
MPRLPEVYTTVGHHGLLGPRKGSAFDAKQRLLQQQAQQELRKAEVKRTRLGRTDRWTIDMKAFWDVTGISMAKMILKLGAYL